MVIAAGLPVANEAKIAVAVVPIFAPIVMGNATSIVRMPAPIKGINNEVVIELLCTITVKIRPARIPIKPFFSRTEFKTASVFFITNDLINFTIRNKEMYITIIDNIKIKT